MQAAPARAEERLTESLSYISCVAAHSASQPAITLMYRGIKGQDNIMDIGSAIGFNSNVLNSMIMYHSNKSTTFGIGTTYHSNLSINTMYTTSSAPISSYTNGIFEIGLRAKFAKKKKPVLYNQ